MSSESVFLRLVAKAQDAAGKAMLQDDLLPIFNLTHRWRIIFGKHICDIRVPVIYYWDWLYVEIKHMVPNIGIILSYYMIWRFPELRVPLALIQISMGFSMKPSSDKGVPPWL